MSTGTAAAADRLLEHYALRATNHAPGEMFGWDLPAARARIDGDPRMQTMLGRTGGGYGYLRALVIAGIATSQERSDISDCS